MPTFNNLDELKRYVEKNCMDIPLSDGKTFGEVMEQEGKRLRDIIIKHISSYYSSYQPKMYSRIMGLVNALQVEPVKQDGNEISVRLWFDDSANHPSVLGGDSGFVPILIDQGWRVSRGWHKDIPHFGFQAPSHFIESSVQEYEANNPYRFKIEVTYG